jgi:hypothetical protein
MKEGRVAAFCAQLSHGRVKCCQVHDDAFNCSTRHAYILVAHWGQLDPDFTRRFYDIQIMIISFGMLF